MACIERHIAIDANPDIEEQWKANRKNDTFINLGVNSSENSQELQTLKFYRFNDGAINTFDKKLAKAWATKGFHFRDIIDVKCRRLPEIADLIH